MNIEVKLNKRVLRSKGYPVTLHVYKDIKDRTEISLKYYSFEKDWNDSRGEPKPSNPDYKAILELIYRVNLKKIDIYRKEHLSSTQIAKQLLGKSDSIYDFWEERILELKKKKGAAGGNAKFYEENLKQWRNFKDPLNYTDINYNLLSKFKDFKSDISPGGRNTYIKALRAIYNEAVKRGYYTPESFITPFNKIMEKVPPTKDKYLTTEEMRKIFANPSDHHFYKIFMICFYLGGLDFVDAHSLQKSNVRNGRVKFVRFKGGTNEVIDNFIFPEAKKIIEEFAEEKYLTPLHKFVYKPYRQKYILWLRKYFKSLGIESYVDSKTPRYTFIDIGKNLMLNRDVIKEITGHSHGDTHSIYEGKFDKSIRDKVHLKIIESIKKKPSKKKG